MTRSVAYLSMHTSPLAQPGVGSAGGMNVYIHELSQTMADRGIEVFVFTRRTDAAQPQTVVQRPGFHIIHLDAGPTTELPVGALAAHVNSFADGVVERMAAMPRKPEVVHSHYWLSGWAGVLVKQATGLPLVNSFHTLGRVQDRTRRRGEPPVTPIRTLTEDEVLARSDAVVASTPHEVADLVSDYGAEPGRLHVSPPGVDHIVFGPGDRAAARRRLGLGDGPLILFAGRIQAQKGIDIAIEALAKLPERVLIGAGRPRLVVVGGPSGERGNIEARHLEATARAHEVHDRVQFVPAQPHAALADFYRAADVLVMPSRSETFGLVAAEAQACGLPVVAANVGGLSHVVAAGLSGIVVDRLEATEFAEALLVVLDEPGVRDRMSVGAVAHAERFSWTTTARRLVALYAAVLRS